MLLPNVDAGAKPCEVGDELAPPPNGDAPNAVDAAPPDGDDAAPNPPEPKAGAGAGAEPKGVEAPNAGCCCWPKGLCGGLFWPNGDWGGFPPPANGLLPPPPPNIAQSCDSGGGAPRFRWGGLQQ